MKINSTLKCSRFRNGIDEFSALKPLQASLIIAIAYIVFISLYIFISGRIASNLSTTVESLGNIELLKGLIFTSVTGMLLFVATYFCLKKIAQRDSVIINQNKSIIATERLVMAGMFSSSVCHDINNIMSIIVGNTEFLIASKNLDHNDRESISQISDSSKRLIDLVKRMMDAGKGYIPGERSYENVSNVINETINFARIHRKIKNCQIRCEIQPNLNLYINSILVGRTLMNLMLNAADATNEAGEILIRLVRDDSLVTIEVHDDGPGITENMQNKIFEPFYTSKNDGNGLGLLSLKICAQQHNGMIKVEKSHLGGACFILSFPAEDNNSKALQSAQPNCENLGGADAVSSGGAAG